MSEEEYEKKLNELFEENPEWGAVSYLILCRRFPLMGRCAADNGSVREYAALL